MISSVSGSLAPGNLARAAGVKPSSLPHRCISVWVSRRIETSGLRIRPCGVAIMRPSSFSVFSIVRHLAHATTIRSSTDKSAPLKRLGGSAATILRQRPSSPLVRLAGRHRQSPAAHILLDPGASFSSTVSFGSLEGTRLRWSSHRHQRSPRVFFSDLAVELLDAGQLSHSLDVWSGPTRCATSAACCIRPWRRSWGRDMPPSVSIPCIMASKRPLIFPS